MFAYVQWVNLELLTVMFLKRRPGGVLQWQSDYLTGDFIPVPQPTKILTGTRRLISVLCFSSLLLRGVLVLAVETQGLCSGQLYWIVLGVPSEPSLSGLLCLW